MEDDDLLGVIDAAQNNLNVALRLAAQGIPVFPCREKAETIDGKQYSAKSPVPKRGLYDASTKESVIRRWWSQRPYALVGFPTGQFTGLAVLDLDRHDAANDGVEALKKLGFDHETMSPVLVKTAGGGIHVYFKWREGIRNKAKHLPSGIDVRGQGGLIIAPGSMFPDGRLYSDADLTKELPEFPDALMPPQTEERDPVAVVTASEWQKTWADDMLIALADKVREAPTGRRYDTLRDASYWAGGVGAHGAIERKRAKALLSEAAKACGLGDSEIDVTFSKGWKDGLKKPVEMAPDPVEDFDDLDAEFDEVEEDADDDLLGTSEKPSKSAKRLTKEEVEFNLGKNAPSWCRKLNERHALAIVGGKTVVLHFKQDNKVFYGSVSDLHAFYDNDRMKVDGESMVVTRLWTQSKHRRSYPEGIVFAPNKDVEGAYNHWQGFSVKASDAKDPSLGCKLFLQHLYDVICDGNEELYRYHLGWLAHMVQKPEEKPGVAVVYKGAKRIGKDTVFEYVGKMFESHYVTVANQDHMVGKFNAHQEKCLLLHVQEGFWAGNKQAEGALKYLITSTSVLVERKGVDAFSVASVLRLFISSNEKWVIPATEDEARYLMVNVSAKRRNDHAYFSALRKEMDGAGPSNLLAYLLDYDISDFQVRAVPNTDALGEQKVAGLRNVEAWWLEILQQGEIEGVQNRDDGVSESHWEKSPVEISRNDLRDLYLRWIKSRRYEGSEASPTEFGVRLHKLCKGILDRQLNRRGDRRRFYKIPSLNECRKQFEAYLGNKVDWNLNQPIMEYDEGDDL